MSSHESRLEYRGVRIYQTPEEIENLRRAVREVKDVEGIFVEVGVFEGATAMVIREEDKRVLYLFDTFAGFPYDPHESDNPTLIKGECSAPKDIVKKCFPPPREEGASAVIISEGVFPQETGHVIKGSKIAFAHIDVDIYKSTKDSLEFILPLMSSGGVILIHDYPAHPGVKKAVDELVEVEALGGRQAIWRKT